LDEDGSLNVLGEQLRSGVFLLQIVLNGKPCVDKVIFFRVITVRVLLDTVSATSITTASAARATAREQQIGNMGRTNE
jgi:hypothetical protein